MDQELAPNTQTEMRLERVVIRQFTEADRDARFELLDQNKDFLAQTVAWARPETFSREFVDEMMTGDLAAFEAGTAYTMGVYLPGDDVEAEKLVGVVDIRGIGLPEGPEIGYSMAEEVTGQGLGTEAAAGLLAFTQAQHPEVTQVRLTTTEANIASQHVAKNLGFDAPKAIISDDGVTELHYVKQLEQHEPDQAS